jgi:hypothetical protein
LREVSVIVLPHSLTTRSNRKKGSALTLFINQVILSAKDLYYLFNHKLRIANMQLPAVTGESTLSSTRYFKL